MYIEYRRVQSATRKELHDHLEDRRDEMVEHWEELIAKVGQKKRNASPSDDGNARKKQRTK